MPFKVVQTSERGKILLSCVPQKWDKNGILMWPRSKADKLIKVEESTPKDDWLSMTCTVKRDNLSYHDAQLAINLMSVYSDTDEDKNFKTPPPPQTADMKSFDDIAAECFEKNAALSEYNLSTTLQTENVIHDNTVSTLPHATESTENTAVIGDYNFLLVDSQNQNIVKTNDINTQKLDHIITSLAALQQNQKVLAETQQVILQQTVQLNIQMEELVKRALIPEKQKSDFKPISSIDELQNFEDKLIDENFQEELLKQLCCICGLGKGKGLDNCFKLVDIIFERSFLKSCSWTGCSRDENIRKICFKGYIRTIKLFYNVIHLSDPNFSVTECESFFKNILRNSNRRSEAKMLRVSVTKHRPKKILKNSQISQNELETASLGIASSSESPLNTEASALI